MAPKTSPNLNTSIALIGGAYADQISSLIKRHFKWYQFSETSLEDKFGESIEKSQEEGQWLSQNVKSKSFVIRRAHFNDSLMSARDAAKALSEYYRKNKMPKDRDLVNKFHDVINETILSLYKLSDVIPINPETKAAPEQKITSSQVPPETRSKNYWILRINGKNWPIDDLKQDQQLDFHSHRPVIGKAPDYHYFQAVRAGDEGYAYVYGTKNSILFSFNVTQGLHNPGAASEIISYKISELYASPVPFSSIESLIPYAKDLEGDWTLKLFPLDQSQADNILTVVRRFNPLPPPLPPDEFTRNSQRRMRLDNDTTFAARDLFFKEDVRAFATTMAQKSVKPPMAIALFGHWGTGKSFFMNQLQASISQLSEFQYFPEHPKQAQKVKPDRSNIYCEGIVQIQFNAWSYLDSNLWAGLVSTILEKLDHYIFENSIPGNAKKTVEKRLSEEMQIISDQKKMIIAKKTTLISNKVALENDIRKHQKNRKDLLEHAKKETLEDFRAKAIEQIRPDIERIKGQLGQFGINEKLLDEPAVLLEEVKSWATFFSNLFKFGIWGKIVLSAVFLVLGFLIINPYNLVDELRNYISPYLTMVIVIVGPTIAKFYDTLQKYRKLLTPVIQLKNKFNTAVASAEFTAKQDLQLLQAKLTQNDIEIENLNIELAEVNEKIQYVGHSLTNSINRMAFDNFIKERRGDTNYEKHLGIISTIRRDFETLSILFQDSVDEASMQGNSDAPATAPEDVVDDSKSSEVLAASNEDNEDSVTISTTEGTIPTNGQDKLQEKPRPLVKGELRQYFTKPLDRIILYIDDLDRCPDDKVIEVLQAVHLLMAFPLFMVVVGVDKRCVHNALMHRNLLQYGTLVNGEDLRINLKKYNITIIEPDEYLEKIFQIPFHLQEPSSGNIEKMIEDLLTGQVNHTAPKEKERDRLKDPQGNTAPSEKAPEDSDDARGLKKPDKPDTGSTKDEKTAENNGETAIMIQTEPAAGDVRPDNLLLEPEEFALLKEISVLVGNTPRTIKRFVNMYRIIRTHESLRYNKKNEQETHIIIMFTLAISVGDFRDEAKILFNDILKNPNLTFAALFQNNEVWKQVQARLSETEGLEPLMNIPVSKAADYVPIAKRFSFFSEETLVSPR